MGILKNKFSENYFRVPNKIFDYELSSGAFQLYCYLLQKGNEDKGFIITQKGKLIIINQEIKMKLNIKSSHTLAKYWAELLDKNLITRTRIVNEKNQVIGGFNYVVKEL